MNTAGSPLSAVLSYAWWAVMLRGIAAMAFGVFAWLAPGISLATLVLLFGVYTLTDGVFGVISAIQGRKEQGDWWVLLWALLGMGVGLLTLFAPGLTELVLLFYIAAWAISTGVLQVVAGIHLRKVVSGEWRLVLAGVVSMAFGAFMIARPVAGALSVIWLIGSYAFLFGMLLVMLALKIRSVGQRLLDTA